MSLRYSTILGRLYNDAYRDWQKVDNFKGAILGTSIGALFGIVLNFLDVFAGNNDVKKIIFACRNNVVYIYLIPFLKYPANPPTVGDGETRSVKSNLVSILYCNLWIWSRRSINIIQRLKQNTKVLAFVGLCCIYLE